MFKKREDLRTQIQNNFRKKQLALQFGIQFNDFFNTVNTKYNFGLDCLEEQLIGKFADFQTRRAAV